MASLAELDALYPYKVVETRDDPFGIALYSRSALQSSSVVAAAPLQYPQIHATAMIGNRTLQVIAAHPPNPIYSNGAYSRNLQLDTIAQLASRSPQPVVVVGDLNISMWASHYRQMIAKSGLHNARDGFGVAPTWPVFLPIAMIPIDHVLVSGDIQVSSFATGPRIGSDHLPILVTLRLR
jgi:endonuclease/exonuclease/phosphatase (EEP) superfamily protein YafD